MYFNLFVNVEIKEYYLDRLRACRTTRSIGFRSYPVQLCILLKNSLISIFYYCLTKSFCKFVIIIKNKVVYRIREKHNEKCPLSILYTYITIIILYYLYKGNY